MTAAAIILAVNVVSSLLKNYVFPRFGTTGIQVVVFICACVGATYYTYAAEFPSLKIFVENVVAIFCLAVTFYEVLLSKIPWFKGAN